MLTLAVCSIGLLSKRFTEAIESLDFRAYDALRAMGVSLLPRIRYAVLPQLGPAFSSAVLYRFDVNIREASVLGLVGAGGIGAPLIFAMNQYAWNDVSAIFLGFVLLVWLIDVGSARLRTRRTAAAAPGNEVRGGQLVVCTAPGIFSNIFSFCDESPDYGTLFLL